MPWQHSVIKINKLCGHDSSEGLHNHTSCITVQGLRWYYYHYYYYCSLFSIRCLCVHTETPPPLCWTPRSTWRQQKNSEFTARRPRLSLASICCTPGRCHTTTPCCPSPAWRTTEPVRTLFFFQSVCAFQYFLQIKDRPCAQVAVT